MPVQKRVRSSPPTARPSPATAVQEEKHNAFRALLQECKSDMEYRIPNIEFRLGVLKKNAGLVPDLSRSIEAMEWEKQTLVVRLSRINTALTT